MRSLKINWVFTLLFELSFVISGMSQTTDGASSQSSNASNWEFNYNKGLELIESKSYKPALPYIQNAYNIAINTTDIDQQIERYSQLAVAYERLREFNKASAALQERLNIIEKKEGRNSLDYAESSGSYVQFLLKISDYEKAISVQENYISFFDDKDKNTEQYAYAAFFMSYAYSFVDEYENEIKYLKEVIGYYGEEHGSFSTFNNNIGLAYQHLGNYEEALPYLSIAITKTKDKTTDGFAIRIQNLAYTYESLGDYKKAELNYQKALDVWDNLDKKDEQYGQLLNNIGKLYRQTGDYEKAKQLFKQALDNFLAKYDETHDRYGYLLNDYASILLITGSQDEAIDLMEKNLRIAKDNGITTTADFYKRQYHLAKAYNMSERYQEALPLLESAAPNIKKIFGIDHPDYGQILKSLGDTNLGIGKIEDAIKIMESSNKILIDQLDQIFRFRSEQEKKAFLSKLSKSFEDLQSIPLNNDSNFDELNELNLNNQLMLKGILLNNSKNILSQLSTLNDAKIKEEIRLYKKLKKNLTQALTQPISEREIKVDSLKSILNINEINLVKLYSSNFNDNESLVKDWKQSKMALNKKEVVIEFSHFNVITKGKRTDSIYYVAYVYDKKSDYPNMIPLFEEQQLKSILEQNITPDELYKSVDLYNLIWRPITKYIGKNKTVYYSPSGLLNQLSFSAIPNRKNVLIKTYDLVQLSSSNVLTSKQNKPDASSTLLVGGINYEYAVDVAEDEMLADNDTYNYLESSSFSNSRGTKSRGESWTYLPGTLNEIESLKSKFKAQGNSVITLTNNDATEENIKKLSGNSPNILHIATHGFFYENLYRDKSLNMDLSTEDRYRLAEDPLLRSGLILAGANYAWKNGSNPKEEEDGILTAMEISNMDLTGTNMVVLSACETGLGDIDGSEGVYGLQRAFKMAGVDIIVMSLWQVPDAETSEFMNAFYENWLDGQEVRFAFNNAQRTMYKKYKDEPLKWAAFVLFN